MISLTPKQMEALRFISGFIQAKGYSPSFREIRDGLGLRSFGRVRQLIGALEDRGAIRRLIGRARAIEVLADIAVPRGPDGAPLHAVRIGGA